MLRIRNLVALDCTALLRINAASQPGVATLDETEFARLLAMPNHHLAVESANRLVVGYALAFSSNAHYDGEEFQSFQRKGHGLFIYIDQVAIQVASRRTGIGSAIYDALENRARLVDAPTLCCEVNIDPPNPESMAFHRHRGFNSAGQLTTRDGRTVALLIKYVN